MLSVNIWTVLLAATGTALATGLGVLPFLRSRQVSERWLGVANAVAGGLMLAASHGLISEGFDLSPGLTMIGLLIGLLLIVLSQRLLQDHELSVANLQGVDARKAMMILGVMTAHSFAEGVGVGVAFHGEQGLGLFIATAIAVHNIPEGLAIALVMVPRGASLLAVAAWSVFSSLPQPLMAVPAYYFVDVFTAFLPIGLGLAAGAMLWMVFAELLSDALEQTAHTTVGATTTLAFICMLGFQRLVLHA